MSWFASVKMNRRVALFLLPSSLAIIDMSWGKALANAIYVLPYTQVYQVVGDTILGIVGGIAGLVLMCLSAKHLIMGETRQ